MSSYVSNFNDAVMELIQSKVVTIEQQEYEMEQERLRNQAAFVYTEYILGAGVECTRKKLDASPELCEMFKSEYRNTDAYLELGLQDEITINFND